jgi:hypothetical protein
MSVCLILALGVGKVVKATCLPLRKVAMQPIKFFVLLVGKSLVVHCYYWSFAISLSASSVPSVISLF